ncbi:MAG: hypothetical protein HEP71_18475 [Roseivirga sp.]|nr:hypothetical protein [Roseivirga sp.]
MVKRKEDMGNPISKSQLTTAFEQLIFREDSAGFFKALDEVNPFSDIWARLQIRSIDVLTNQGLGHKARNKAYSLKNSLTDRVLRKQAEIKYLYLDQAVNGRNNTDLLKSECLALLENPAYSSIHLLVRETMLRLEATKLMRGLSDANNKKPLIKKYINLIKAYERNQSFEEAYNNLMDLIEFLLRKPLPMQQRTLAYLLYYRRLSFITIAPHRLAFVDLQIAQIRLEDQLRGAVNHDYLKHYELAKKSFDKARHALGKFYIQKSQGQTLLRYGKVSGRRLLNGAARGFEAKGQQVQSLSIYTSIIQWLQTKGEQWAISSYNLRVNELREELSLHTAQVRPHSEIKEEYDGNDLLENTNKAIALTYKVGRSHTPNRNTRLLEELTKKVRQKGETIHLARLIACEAEVMDVLTDLCNSSKTDDAIKLFVKLGYPIEATLLLREHMLAIGLHGQNTGSSPELSGILQSDLASIEDILQNLSDLESQEVLALHYQAAAYAWMITGLPQEGIKLLEKAEHGMKKHGLRKMLAFNELYMGCLFLETDDHSIKNEFCLHAYDHFNKALQQFKVINHWEGRWRSQFGMALSTHRHIALGTKKSALLIKDCSENYLRAIEAVHYLTIHHLKTATRFGESYVFSTRLQKGADQLYAAAIDFFVNIVRDSSKVSSLLEKKRVWVLLNRNRTKVKMN